MTPSVPVRADDGAQPALVTVGIPTYERAALLSRALASVSRQTYPNLQVLVSDNASSGTATQHIAERYGRVIAGLEYIRHQRTMPVLDHFLFLLGQAHGRYFMWLADDDEISPNYVADLVRILDTNDDAATACGHWVLMKDPTEGDMMPTSSYPQASPLGRALRFIWHSDDAFFYGLHRTAILRQANFRGYWWPNTGVPLNWAYVYLLDVLLRGRVVQTKDKSVQFINHDYSLKSYPRRRGALRLMAFISRRINVQYLYWQKCARVLHPVAMPLVVLTSVLSLVREAASLLSSAILGRRRPHIPTNS